MTYWPSHSGDCGVLQIPGFDQAAGLKILNLEDVQPRTRGSVLSRRSNSATRHLLVMPGYGYFADTENIIHDASTMSIELSNAMSSVRGRFGLFGGDPV